MQQRLRLPVGSIVETDVGMSPELEFVTGNGGLADRAGVALTGELVIPVPDRLVAVVGELVLLAASEEDPLDGAERVEFDGPGAVLVGLEDGNDTGSAVEFETGEPETADGIVEENGVERRVDEKTVGKTVPLAFDLVTEKVDCEVGTPGNVEFDDVAGEDLIEPEEVPKSGIDDVNLPLLFRVGALA